jgi:hypothetical protein
VTVGKIKDLLMVLLCERKTLAKENEKRETVAERESEL